MYDAKSLRSALKREEEEEEDIKDDELKRIFRENSIGGSNYEPVEFVIGRISVPYTDILGYADSYDRDRPIEVVKKKGFNALEVFLKDSDPVLCSLTMEEFEQLYNDHVNNLNG